MAEKNSRGYTHTHAHIFDRLEVPQIVRIMTIIFYLICLRNAKVQ